jgi:protein-S-isoprenylcysteine O-methyltransferase Ste14
VRTSTAALGSAAFFVVAPGTFVGLGPWLITHWEIPGSSPPLRLVLGVVLIVLGLIPPVHAFIQFARAGGTPMPIAPTERLVVTGFNRFVRNPMYVGLLTAILGQALLFDSIWLVVYAAIGWIVTASFVRWYEEPTLVQTYGEQYEEYRRRCHRDGRWAAPRRGTACRREVRCCRCVQSAPSRPPRRSGIAVPASRSRRRRF